MDRKGNEEYTYHSLLSKLPNLLDGTRSSLLELHSVYLFCERKISLPS